MKLKKKAQNVLFIALLALCVLGCGVTKETSYTDMFIIMVAIGGVFGILWRYGTWQN